MSVTGAVDPGPALPALVGGVRRLAALLAFSRVYLRVHYLLDVLAGLVLGSVFVALFVWLAPAAVSVAAPWRRASAIA